MDARRTLGTGAALATLGATGIVLGSLLHVPALLARPWGFLLGFALGVIAGVGAALSVKGLVELRHA